MHRYKVENRAVFMTPLKVLTGQRCYGLNDLIEYRSNYPTVKELKLAQTLRSNSKTLTGNILMHT